MNKKLIISLIILVLIILGGFGYFKMYDNPVEGPKPSRVIDNTGNTNETINNRYLSEPAKEQIVSYLENIDSEITDKGRLFWLREDNKFIGLPAQELYREEFNSLNETILAVDEFKYIFEKQGFTINQTNNIPEGEFMFIDPTIGFEKGDIKCMLSWDKTNKVEVIENPTLKLSCGYYTKEAEDNFNIFYSLVTSDKSSRAVRVWVSKKTDNFVMGSIGALRGGSNWYASKQGGEWIVDEITQDAICYFKDIVNRYPQNFLPENELKLCEGINN